MPDGNPGRVETNKRMSMQIEKGEKESKVK